MAAIREIATRWTLQGLAQVRTTTRRIRDLVADAARRAGDSVKGFASASVRHIGTVTKAAAGLTFKGLVRGSQLAFKGIGLAAVASAAKIGLISLAAKKATDEMAEYLRKLDTLSKQTGENVEDVATLRFAAEQNGGDPDELLPTLGTIADTFGEIRKSIEEADEAYEKTTSWSKRGMLAAFRTGSADTAQRLLDEAVTARLASLKGIENRKAAIDSLVRQTGRGGRLYENARRSGLSDRDTEVAMSRRRLALVREFKELMAAEEAIRDGFGPAGEALEELKEVGLDMDRALRGGTDTLYALADALEKIPDSNRKLGIAQQLFGGDAGAKNLALLEGGTAAIDRYRREMDSFGAVPTKEDAERGTNLKQSEGRRDMALQGVKLEVNRGLSPLMEETNDQLAGWLSRNRMVIAQMVQETFIAVRTVFYDILKFIEGNTDYESAIFKKGAAILAWSRKVIVAISEIASVTFGEVGKILSGLDSDWEWLNRVRDAFVWIKTLAEDAFSVLTGKDAKDFLWLNDLRDGVRTFFASLKEAWGMFKNVLDGIHAAIKPVLDFFGKDILTAALFLGMLRFSGILGGIVAMGRGLLGIFTPALAGIGTAAALAAGKVALIAAAFIAAWKAGEWIGGKLAEPIVARATKTQETIAETMRLRDQAFMRDKLAKAGLDERIGILQNMGVNTYGRKTKAQERAEMEAWAAKTPSRGFIIKPDGSEPTLEEQYRSAQRWKGRTTRLEVSLGGKVGTFFGGPETESFLDSAERADRMGR